MPRQARLDAPGLLQHVMARGIERREIFGNDEDRKDFLGRFAFLLEETRTQCYAWALIPNHFHLLLRTGPVSLKRLMRRLLTGYAGGFNRRHKRCGHLFQNRYKSIVCEEDNYLLELIRYIHLNPLRADLVEDLDALEKYPWSGHGVLVGAMENPLVPVLHEKSRISQAFKEQRKFSGLAEKTVDEVLAYFGKNLADARRKYRNFVEKGFALGRRPEFQGGGLFRSSGGKMAALSELKKGNKEKSDSRVLGGGDFVKAALRQAEKRFEKKYLPKRPIGEIVEEIAGKAGLSPQSICSKSRTKEICRARALFAYMAVEETGCTCADIANFLGISQSSVLNAVKRGKILFDQSSLQDGIE